MRPAHSFVRALAWSILASVSAHGCDKEPIPMDLGVPRELAEHRSATIGGLTYDIRLNIPERRSEPIEGRMRMRFVWADRDEQPLVIDFAEPELRVRSLRVNAVDAIWEPVNDHIVVPASTLNAAAVNMIEIEFEAGDEAMNRGEDFLYALFVPDRAHSSLPVFDQPDLKARVGWEVSVPVDWLVLANGPLYERTVLNERSTHHFASSNPVPPYVLSVVAGRFEYEEEVLEGRYMRMLHREADSARVARNRDEIFRLHRAALAWLEEYTGIEYPFQKMDFALIPAFQYGGMEHPGSILYREDRLFLDESATRRQILARASVIAHEVAHMWFGNLVTMRWFDDVWTKEVFANFIADKITAPEFPDLDHDLRFLTAHHSAAYGVDRTAGTHPVRQRLDNLDEAGTLYGPIIYQKAPVVMRQLESRMGETPFREGLQEYLESHAYGNASWPDLVAILDRRSEQALSDWSRVWVEEAGRPTITVDRDGADAVLTQSDPTGEGRVWPQRLAVRFGSVDEHRVVEVESQGEPVRVAGAGDAAFVLPNGSGLEYGAFRLDAASRAYLLDHVSDLTPAVVRGAAWLTLWDEVLERRLEPGDFVDAALLGLDVEEDELVLGQLLGLMETAYWRLLPADARLTVAESLESVLWERIEGDAPRTARAAMFGSFRRIALTEQGIGRLLGLWDGRTRLPDLPLSESDLTALASDLALRAVDDADQVLDAQEARITNADRLERFRFVRPSLAQDEEARADFFRSLSDPQNRAREPWVLEGLRNLHHPLRREASLELVGPGLRMLEEVHRTGDIFFPARWLDATLSGYGTRQAADTVRAFLDGSPGLAPRLRLKTLQSADLLFRAERTLTERD